MPGDCTLRRLPWGGFQHLLWGGLCLLTCHYHHRWVSQDREMQSCFPPRLGGVDLHPQGCRVPWMLLQSEICVGCGRASEGRRIAWRSQCELLVSGCRKEMSCSQEKEEVNHNCFQTHSSYQGHGAGVLPAVPAALIVFSSPPGKWLSSYGEAIPAAPVQANAGSVCAAAGRYLAPWGI